MKANYYSPAEITKSDKQNSQAVKTKIQIRSRKKDARRDMKRVLGRRGRR